LFFIFNVFRRDLIKKFTTPENVQTKGKQIKKQGKVCVMAAPTCNEIKGKHKLNDS
jgi:hypothetical protein